jgi:hypothetical protein
LVSAAKTGEVLKIDTKGEVLPSSVTRLLISDNLLSKNLFVVFCYALLENRILGREGSEGERVGEI